MNQVKRELREFLSDECINAGLTGTRTINEKSDLVDEIKRLGVGTKYFGIISYGEDESERSQVMSKVIESIDCLVKFIVSGNIVIVYGEL